MGINVDFAAALAGAVAYTDTDHMFTVLATDVEGQTFNSSGFSEAEYVIADEDGTILVTKTLGNGIERENSGLTITVPAVEMTFEGSYKHQLTLFNLSGNKMAPVFNEFLLIKPTL